MKILMVTMSMDIGGAETHILELCRELASLGHSITLASFGGVYVEELEKYGVRHVCLPLNTKNLAKVGKAYRGLKRLILEEEFDLVHAHARIPAFICGLLWDTVRLSGGRKFRFVTTSHLNFSVNPLWRRISRWGERVMAVSDDIVEYMISEYGYPRDRIHVTINGIDMEKFSAEIPYDGILAEHSLEKSRRRIVYMSRLDADRSDPAHRLIAIAPKLYEKYPDCDILIVGGGGELEEIRNKADAVNAGVGRKIITVTGGVSNTNEYVAAATVFVGVSRSVLEAMSAAKPVIVAGNQGALGIFDESKIKTAVNTNFCCRGCALETEETLLDDLSTLLDMSESALEEIGRYNREFVKARYTAQKMAQDYVEMYETLLASPIPFYGKPDVLVSGYYGFGNLGDESLLDIITSSIAETIPNVKIAALTRHPKRDQRKRGIRCVSRFNPFAVFRAVRHSKLLISGGGSLLQDKTSSRSLRYYASVIKMAENVGTKTFVMANGIGPISSESGRKLTGKVVGDADRISVRDAESAVELVRLGVASDKIKRTADPAFLIRPIEGETLEKVLERIGICGRYFAVSIRPMVAEAEPQDADIRNAGLLADLLTRTAKKHGLVPLIIPMQPPIDLPICELTAKKYRENSGENAVIYCPDSAPELMGVLSRAEFAVGMRLHLIIFASSAGVPVIALSYDPKVSSTMAYLDQPYCVDMNDDYAADLDRHIEDVIEHTAEIRAGLKLKAESMRALARDDLKTVAELLKN